MCHPSEAQLIRRHAQVNRWNRTAPNSKPSPMRSKRLPKPSESIMDQMKSEMKAAVSEAVTQATARRVSPSPSPKLSFHRSKTRTRHLFDMTELENEHPIQDEAVAMPIGHAENVTGNALRSRAERQFGPNRSHPLKRGFVGRSPPFGTIRLIVRLRTP